MSLTKEECREAYEVIDTLLHLMCGEKREDVYEPTMDEMISSMNTLKQLINEHFDNPPLKFEQLKPNMWVWDNKDNKYNKIIEINNDKIGFYYITNSPTRFNCKFEENRFFRYEVKDDE